ncbi:DUF1702 family protein [Streptomyces sp. UNOB3_S3]|uniref:DUF1702 family protein n=1 Tax=Streptomyces sp. UNOB3_S3 TaxID=2871682 RepID=UPI001E468044|nr:DUF1702 family protein [Streptomyces sp. UNOB3_S3]MCC3779027.1 DUF1702 family protein [Streptomyces sp. UNOB3_S3]
MPGKPSAPPRSRTRARPGPAAPRWARRLCLREETADFAVRGFPCDRPESRRILERHGRSFLTGFNTALTAAPAAVQERLTALDAVERGFAYEGAGMACALLDTVALTRGRRVRALLRGPGRDYVHLVHVGAGWALAKAPLPGARRMLGLDPLLGWLALDGLGFSHGYFGGRTAVARLARKSPPRPGGTVRHQGLGRSLWFVEAADPDRIADTVAAFPEDRRSHLWSGVGLAACYAGGATDTELDRLRERSGPYWQHLAQGAAFAAEARRRGGHIPEHTHRGVLRLVGVDAVTAAGWTLDAERKLRGDGSLGDFLAWRALISGSALASR